MVIVEARGNAFGLLVGERGEVDDADEEVRRGLALQVIVPVNDDGTITVRAPAPYRCCGQR